MSFLTLFYTPMLLASGYLICTRIAKSVGITQSLAARLYLWHSFFCLVYIWFVSNYGGDALGYFDKAGEWAVVAAVGTRFVVSFTGVLVQIFGFGLFDCFFLFNIFGAIGLIFFAALLHSQFFVFDRKMRRIAYLMLFLPSVSFWSSGIGKDAISFFSTCTILFACLSIRRRFPLLLIGLGAMFLVRPHIAVLQAGALIAALLFAGGSQGWIRIVGFGAMAGVMVILGPVAMEYAKIEDLQLETIQQYQEDRSSHQFSGRGAVDIASMGLPGQVFTYLYRPNILDVSSVFSAVSAVENLIILYLTLWALTRVSAVRFGSFSFSTTYSAVLLMGGVLALAPATANMGIALRQKWMIMPALLFLCIKLISAARYRRLQSRG